MQRTNFKFEQVSPRFLWNFSGSRLDALVPHRHYIICLGLCVFCITYYYYYTVVSFVDNTLDSHVDGAFRINPPPVTDKRHLCFRNCVVKSKWFSMYKMRDKVN